MALYRHFGLMSGDVVANPAGVMWLVAEDVIVELYETDVLVFFYGDYVQHLTILWSVFLTRKVSAEI